MTEWVARSGEGSTVIFDSDTGDLEFDVDCYADTINLTYTQARELRDALEYYMGVLGGRTMFGAGTNRV